MIINKDKCSLSDSLCVRVRERERVCVRVCVCVQEAEERSEGSQGQLVPVCSCH